MPARAAAREPGSTSSVEAAAEPVLRRRAARRGGHGAAARQGRRRRRDLLRGGRGFRALCDEHGALFWLNDRPDLARRGGADGVHVGQDDEPVAEVRELVGPGRC